MLDGLSDFELKFLDYSPSVAAGGQVSPDVEEEAELLDAYSQAVTGVVTRVGPAVVRIHVKKAANGSGRTPDETEGSGSGVIIAPDGYMLEMVLLREWTTRFERSIVPAESPN